MATITIEAPAKINLFLEVLGKRRDGYHEIRTIMQSIELCDLIILKERREPGIHLTIKMTASGNSDMNNLPPGKDNLAYRAAELFLQESEIKKGVEIYLEKNIPVGAGLGGGSSDAAGVLVGLNRLWNTGFSKNRLRKMGEHLGMDVPFFIEGGTAYATGRGERIFHISGVPHFWVVLIDPGFSVSTKWAYGNIGKNFLTKKPSYAKIVLKSLLAGDIASLGKNLYNEFERVLEIKYSGFLRETKRLLKDTGAKGVLMTGTGPVVFGIFKERGDANRSFVEIGRKARRVYLTKTRGGVEDGNHRGTNFSAR